MPYYGPVLSKQLFISQMRRKQLIYVSFSFFFFFYTWNQGNLTVYLLILGHAGTMLYDLRPDWIVKKRLLICSSVRLVKEVEPSVLCALLAGGYVNIPPFLKRSAQAKKLVCGFHCL